MNFSITLYTHPSAGVWSEALSKQLDIAGTVQSALTAVRNTMEKKHGLHEDQFPQYISNGFPEVTWLPDVQFEGGRLREDLPADFLLELNAFKAEMEIYRGTLQLML